MVGEDAEEAVVVGGASRDRGRRLRSITCRIQAYTLPKKVG